jgi:alpha-beta hydrolase superfamily lysophospholipase
MTKEIETSPLLDIPEFLDVIFSPRRVLKPSLPPSCKDLEILVEGSTISLGCRFHCTDKKAPLIVYFHGNGEIVSDYDQIGRWYTDVGVNIFIVSYRGYGWSGGTPSVAALLSDNIEIMHFVKSYCQKHNLSGPLFVMGRSLGCVSAIDCAYRLPEYFKGLIIESGFADTLPLAARLGFDSTKTHLKEEDCFNNIKKIQDIRLPTLILHGASDHIIPLHEAEKLQAESGARAKQFHLIPGADHNSLILVGGALYFESIKKFIDTSTGKNTWRQRRKQFKQK